MWLDAFDKDALIETAKELTRGGFKPGCDHMTGKRAELWFNEALLFCKRTNGSTGRTLTISL